MADGFLQRRDRLVGMLDQVAELEHALCCMYLYTAFSLKNRKEEGVTLEQLELIRGWKKDLLLIARQEMVHLATVANLLGALGEAPYFRRPDFPTPKDYYPLDEGLQLMPFSHRFLSTALSLEEPPDDDNNPDAISELYERIEAELEELGAMNHNALFIGPPDAQIDNTNLFPTWPDRSNFRSRPRYDVLLLPVRDLDEARNAIRRVRLEGEGTPKDNDEGHYQLFQRMREEYTAELEANPGFEPSRNVVINPWREEEGDLAPDKEGRTLIDHPLTVKVAGLFDLAYEILLRMLLLFFTRTPLTSRSFRTLEAVAFFPMMTQVVRPLGEILTQMPAEEGDDGWQGPFAGAAFRCPRRVARLPHDGTAWQVLEGQLRQLRDRAEEAADCSDIRNPDVRARLKAVKENTWRLHYNFDTGVTL